MVDSFDFQENNPGFWSVYTLDKSQEELDESQKDLIGYLMGILYKGGKEIGTETGSSQSGSAPSAPVKFAWTSLREKINRMTQAWKSSKTDAARLEGLLDASFQKEGVKVEVEYFTRKTKSERSTVNP